MSFNGKVKVQCHARRKERAYKQNQLITKRISEQIDFRLLKVKTYELTNYDVELSTGLKTWPVGKTKRLTVDGGRRKR